MDRDPGAIGGTREWPFNPRGCDAGSRGARYRLGGDHAGGRLEVAAHAFVNAGTYQKIKRQLLQNIEA